MAIDYGRDVSCTTELRTARYSTGVRLVGEAYYRRLTTPRGQLRGGEDEANYGLDITAFVGRGDPKSVIASLPGQIESELMKDERSEDITVTVEQEPTDGGIGIKLLITITAVTTEGPFSLQLSVDDVSAELLGIVEA